MDVQLTIEISIILVLIIFSAFFSGSETGLTAASRAKLHKLKIEGNKNASKAWKLRNQKNKLISSILLGNNIVNILASALMTKLMITHFAEAGVLYATLIMTALLLIFAEVLPKTYAIQNAEKVAMLVSPAFTWLVKLFSPITYAIDKIVDVIIRALRLNSNDDDLVSGEEALRGAIDLHHIEGAVVTDEKNMLGGVLDLSKMAVDDIMIHRKKMYTLDIEQPLDKIISEIIKCQFTRIPFWKNDPDNIIGILHVKDLLSVISRKKKVHIESLLIKPWFIPKTTLVKSQLVEFRIRKKHFSLVVDEYGVIQGMVTLEDILEEIVGEITDEHDVTENHINKNKDGSYMIDGMFTVRDLNRELDWKLPDDKANTVAGLIINELERIPDVGEKFNFYDTRFEISEKNGSQITKIRLYVTS